MKRALIITYYWPPAGGPGVQRWLKFIKYFKDFDIEPIVFVPENPSYPLMDEKFIDEVPSDLEIIKLPIKEPYGLAKFMGKKKTTQLSSGIISAKNESTIEKVMLFVRGNFFIPDARIGWVKPSVQFLSNYLKENPVDVLITTGPPHSLHLIGIQLKRIMGIKWLADFRDPWTTIHYHQSLRLNERSQKKHEQLEKEVLNTADVLVVTSPSTKAEFNLKTKVPIHVITNGYDEDIEDIVVERDQRFTISHIGSLLSGRNPEIFWMVLKELMEELPSFKEDLQLNFAGALSEEVKNSISEKELTSNSNYLGYISHAEALKLQKRSQLLLLVEMDRPETKCIIPGKLFEYLAAQRPIIAFGPHGSDIKGILDETQAGLFFHTDNKNEVKSSIIKYYNDFKNKGLEIAPKDIRKYSRRELTHKMANLIKSL